MTVDLKNETQTAIMDIQRAVPKLCSSIQVLGMANTMIVLTMVYGDPKTDTVTLIERIAIDKDHAKKLSEILLKAVGDVENAANL